MLARWNREVHYALMDDAVVLSEGIFAHLSLVRGESIDGLDAKLGTLRE